MFKLSSRVQEDFIVWKGPLFTGCPSRQESTTWKFFIILYLS